jgi:thiamine pyrophosphokinase
MKTVIVQSQDAVTVVGGGPVSRRDLGFALLRAPVVVAADGGADRVLAAGLMPRAVIGDFDSISDAAMAAIPADRLFRIAEQESTDFDKVLRSVDAPFVLALGVTGARVDHGLAVLNTLVRQKGGPCLVISTQDVIFHAPRHVNLTLKVGDRLSLFPMGSVTGTSRGLHWPIAGLQFATGGQSGTSNRVSEAEVQLRFDGPGMLVILPRTRLDAAISALVPKWRGPRRAPRGVRGE